MEQPKVYLPLLLSFDKHKYFAIFEKTEYVRSCQVTLNHRVGAVQGQPPNVTSLFSSRSEPNRGCPINPQETWLDTKSALAVTVRMPSSLVLA